MRTALSTTGISRTLLILQEKMRIARELLRSGVAVPVVAGSTGLAEEQVRVLEGEID